MGSGILRAVGDSKRPLYFLIAASLTNVVLDLLFVLAFHWNVAGVAIATVASQGISAVLVMWVLMTTKEPYRVELGKIRIDKRMMKRVLAVGIPSGIQQSIISLSNVIVQSNINVYGSAAMAGFGSYSKIEGFIMLPLQTTCNVGHHIYRPEHRSEKVRPGQERDYSGNDHERYLHGGGIRGPLYLRRDHTEDLQLRSGCDSVRAGGYPDHRSLLSDHDGPSDHHGNSAGGPERRWSPCSSAWEICAS